MKHEFRYHLFSSLIAFIIISISLVIIKIDNIQLIYTLLGLFIGSFILDIDHFIYWLLLKPNTEESRLVKSAIQHRDFKAVYRVLKTSHQTHHSLIFHHYFFQVILALFSFLVFTSTDNLFILSLIIALNLHLLVDETLDYLHNPKILQKWLFARESNQLPIKFLNRYIFVFFVFLIIFIILLIKSQI